MKPLVYLFCSAWFSLTVFWVNGQEAVELRRFSAPNATQAVAVDSLYFYTISNSRIVKRKKSDGEEVDAWSGPLKHLNSGIVLDGKLYCSNTNFPQTPMASSLEIFDAETLEHTDNHSFGIYTGSFTWIDKKDGDWFLMFVHYDEKGKERNKGVAYSSLIRTDSTFRRKAGWTLPPKFIDHLAPMSVSGGAFLPDGRLLLSPHHYEEVYVFSFPKMGYELTWEQTIPVPFQGQGLALDPYEEKVVWGIHRQKREVVSVRIDY
jgi:hypothetical protein